MSQKEMEQCLKDANLYEENMSDDQVSSYYHTLKESERSAIELQNKSMNESVNELLTAMNDSEDTRPSLKEQMETEIKKVFIPKEWVSAKKKNILGKVEAQNKENNNNDHENEVGTNENESNKANEFADDAVIFDKASHSQSNDKTENEKIFDKLKSGGVKIQTTFKFDNFKSNNQIGFNDMPKSVKVEKNMLKILSHELKRINIQNSKKFLSANNETRIKMLFEYHIASEKLRAQIAKLSRTIAPLPKPITNTDNSNIVSSSDGGPQNSPTHTVEEFVSRAGRHIKRKIYCDEDSQDSIPSSPNKKAKTSNDNDEWNLKTYSGPKVAKLPKKCDIVSSTTHSNISEDPVIEDVDENKPKKTPGRPKLNLNKKLSNDEIIQRCSLFSDSPNRRRSGALVTAGIEEENRRIKAAEKIEEFNASLQVSQDDEPDEILDFEVVEIPVEKRRVIPTIPHVGGRKPINNRKRKNNGVETLGITTNKKLTSNISSSSDEVVPVNGSSNNDNGNKRNASKKGNNNGFSSEPSSSTSRGNVRGAKIEESVMCPLCSVLFPKNSIQEHASTCGEELVTQSTPKSTRISCPECDKLIYDDYDKHVDDCRRQKQRR